MSKLNSVTIRVKNPFFYAWCIYFLGNDGITRDYSGFAYTFIGARFGVWNKVRKLSKKPKEERVVYRWKAE